MTDQLVGRTSNESLVSNGEHATANVSPVRRGGAEAEGGCGPKLVGVRV